MKLFLERAVESFAESKLYLLLIGTTLVLLRLALSNSDAKALPNAAAVLQSNSYKTTHNLRRRLKPFGLKIWKKRWNEWEQFTGTPDLPLYPAIATYACLAAGAVGMVYTFIPAEQLMGLIMMGTGFTLGFFILILMI